MEIEILEIEILEMGGTINGIVERDLPPPPESRVIEYFESKEKEKREENEKEKKEKEEKEEKEKEEESSSNPAVRFSSRVIVMKDSRDITKQDQESLLKTIQQTKTKRILIPHGTCTMTKTSSFLSKSLSKEELSQKSILFVGSLIPLNEPNSDAFENLSFAFENLIREPPPFGVWVAMNRNLWFPDSVEKDLQTGEFRKKN